MAQQLHRRAKDWFENESAEIATFTAQVEPATLP